MWSSANSASCSSTTATKRSARCCACWGQADAGVVAVWDALENVPAFAALVGLLDHTAGKAAGDALRAPFVLGHKQALARLFDAAGAERVEITTHRGTARFPSVRELVEAELRGWLPVMDVNLSEPEIGRILAEAEQVLAPHATRDGKLVFHIAAHIVSARKP